MEMQATLAAGSWCMEAAEAVDGGDISCTGVGGGSRGGNEGDSSCRRGGTSTMRAMEARAAAGELAEAAGVEMKATLAAAERSWQRQQHGSEGDNSCKRGGGGRRS